MGVKVQIKFCDSRSNRSRDIRLGHFVMNDDDNNDDTGPYDNRAKRLRVSCLKMA